MKLLFSLFVLCNLSFAAVRQVGPGKKYARPCQAIAAAKAGDIIEIDAAGVYKGDVCGWATERLTLRGVNGRPVLHADGKAHEGKGIWVISGNDTIVENIEFTGAAVPDQNGTGIRLHGRNLTVRDCSFHHNETGLLTGADANSEILVEHSEFAYNGHGEEGQSHNIYIGYVRKFTFRFNYSHHANYGQLVKSRAAENHILYNRLTTEKTGKTSYEIDLPSGGKSYIIGNVVEQGPEGANESLVSYLRESAPPNPSTQLFVINNTFINNRSIGTFINIGGKVTTPAIVRNNIFVGPGRLVTQSNAIVENNLVKQDPKFVDPANYDFHLQSGSPAIDKGIDPGTDGAFSFQPAYQYVNPGCSESRTKVGPLDVGAYEFKGGKMPGHGSCQAGVSRRVAARAVALAPLAALAAANAADNSVTIQNRSKQAQPNRPVSVSRFFASGDIPKFAEAVIGGTAVPTQCDVKTRWPDGSLQHAVVSFSVNLPAKGSAKVSFRNQAQGNNEGFLKAQDMLSDKFDLGAAIEVSGPNGQKFAADIRRMIADGAFQYWLKGPQCTQVIAEDRTQAFKYDFGFTAHKSLHPIFVATFYPGWKGVKVEMILENMWFSKLQDQTYSYALKTGNPLKPEPAYSKTDYRHSALTRWRKIVWSGPTPGDINIDYNLAYMVRSKALPNYDISKKVSDKAIRAEIATFQATDRGELSAQWTTKMWDTGANSRGDIGLAPRWYVLYLFTFHPGLYEVMLGNAAASSLAPIHIRDSASGVFFDSAKQTSSLGRILSVEGRPTVRTGKWVGDSSPQDEIRPVGPIGGNGWETDLPHQPSFGYVPYLITGDWYFLEEMYFWAAYNLAWPNPTISHNKLEYTRNGAWGYLNENGIESRGAAWGLRTVGEAAFLAPDGSPEKKYFTTMVLNNIAVREGVFDIRDGNFCKPDGAGNCSNPLWQWGRKSVGSDMPNPLYLITAGAACTDGGQICGGEVDPSKATRVNAPWMYNYNLIVWGRLKEMGFPIAKLQATVSKSLLHQFLDPAYNPYMVEEYRIPTTDRSGKYFTNWRTLAEAYLDYQKRLNKRQFVHFPDLVEGSYVHIARAAASFLPGVNDGALKGEDAWKWILKNEPAQHLMNDNPKWALVPRE